MLVCTRTLDQEVELQDEEGEIIAVVKIVGVSGKKVRLGIEAASEIKIYRDEVADQIREQQGEQIVKIDPNIRCFKLKPRAVELFMAYSDAAREARNARIKFAEEFLVAQGVPEDVAKAGLYPRSFNAAFPKEVCKHAPKLFNRPDKNGYCQLKGTLKITKQFERDLKQIKIPKVHDYLPTLNVGQMWFMGTHMLSVVVGAYGPHIILKGGPRNIPADTLSGRDQEPYEPDLDLLEEMTLAEWAALVAEVEQAEYEKSTKQGE